MAGEAVWSSLGLGRYAPGELDVVLLPRGGGQDGSAVGVVYCHVSGGSALSASDPYNRPGEWALVRGIAQRHPVVVADLGGPSTFGNATAIARVDDARTYLQDAWGARPGPIHLVGTSMGALNALGFAALNRDLVSAVVGVLPLVDLDELYRADPDVASSLIAAAWGVTAGADLPPLTSPVERVPELLGLPFQAWYASDDPVVSPLGVVALCEALGPPAEAHALGALGHTDAAIGRVTVGAVLDYLAAHPDPTEAPVELASAS